MGAPLRIVFLGSDAIALPLLSRLAGDPGMATRIEAILTQPDRPAGRGQKAVPNAVKAWATGLGIPVFQPEKMDRTVQDSVAALSPDVALVMAYGHILSDAFIAVPRHGTLNLHASLLPRHRGASPIQTAIACGERETGVSLMRIVAQLDAGPVADVERVPVGPLDTAADVEKRLAAACVPLVARALPRLREGSLAFADQDQDLVTYCRRLSKEDGALDFRAAAGELAARVNGLFPWPGCQVEIDGRLVKIGLADVAGLAEAGCRGQRPRLQLPTPATRTTAQAPGTVLGSDAEGLLVATSDGVLRLRRLQRPAGRMLPAAEFLRGFPIREGTLIPSRSMRPLSSKTPFPRR